MVCALGLAGVDFVARAKAKPVPIAFADATTQKTGLYAASDATLETVHPHCGNRPRARRDLANGVLTIRIPKHPKTKPRKIAIGRGLGIWSGILPL